MHVHAHAHRHASVPSTPGPRRLVFELRCRGRDDEELNVVIAERRRDQRAEIRLKSRKHQKGDQDNSVFQIPFIFYWWLDFRADHQTTCLDFHVRPGRHGDDICQEPLAHIVTPASRTCETALWGRVLRRNRASRTNHGRKPGPPTPYGGLDPQTPYGGLDPQTPYGGLDPTLDPQTSVGAGGPGNPTVPVQ
ncbi:unnamed protein product [Arctogadus glacialis]